MFSSSNNNDGDGGGGEFRPLVWGEPEDDLEGGETTTITTNEEEDASTTRCSAEAEFSFLKENQKDQSTLSTVSTKATKLVLIAVLSYSGGLMISHHLFSSQQHQRRDIPSAVLPATRTPHVFRPPGQLRLDWEHLEPVSKLAREFVATANNCSASPPNHSKLMYLDMQPGGLGSRLFYYTYAMCLAHREGGVRLYMPQFIFADPTVAWTNRESVSAMNAIFTKLELPCPGDEQLARAQQEQRAYIKGRDPNLFDIYKLWHHRRKTNVCESLLERPGYKGVYSNLDVPASSIEAMFTAGLSPLIVEEARRQHALVFGARGAPPSEQLICVHVRWGDKGTEMELVDISEYIAAVYEIAHAQGLAPHETHVFLATEDPAAVQAFQDAMDEEWNLYIDQFYKDMLPFRNNETQVVADVAIEGHASTGLLAFGSLLVAMEANHFVLTSASNWSKLMNSLRRTVIRSTCPGGFTEPSRVNNDVQQKDCTSALDLRAADFWMELDFDGNGL
eukprot:scaffold25177_cov169-Amphora_coffeaeformis.AAC.2